MQDYNNLVDILEGERFVVMWDGLVLSAEEAAARISNRLADKN